MLSFNDILPYLQQGAGRSKPGPKLLHSFYNKSLLHRDEIEKVFDDTYPKYLDKDRPREQPEHKKYRKDVYENVFRGFKNRIIGALDYIRQADDFDVQFPTTEVPEPDSLKTYTDQRFSPEGSLVEWFFSNVKSDYVDDPNAVLLILPTEPTLFDTEYSRPQVMIIPSPDVWMFRRGKFAVLVSPEKTLLPGDAPEAPSGNVLFFLDHDSYTIARQTGMAVNESGQSVADWLIIGVDNVYDQESGALLGQTFIPSLHYCKTMPARKLGLRKIKKNTKGEEFYESMIADALPHIRLGQRNQSDIQVETNFHVASKEWRESTHKCTAPGCVAGIVHIRDDIKGTKTGEPSAIIDVVECPKCQGSGYAESGSGLGIIWVEREGGKTPTDLRTSGTGAPGGFIPRPIDGLKTFVEEFKRNAEAAYTEINMQFVRTTPYEQSGTSKRYDRQEMTRDLIVTGAHLIDLLGFGFECIDCQMFGPSNRQGEQMPEVMVPVRLDLDNAEMTREELNNAKDKKYDPALIEGYEKKLLLYTTGEQSDEYRRYVLRIQCDPYKDHSDEMKAYLLGVAFRNPEDEQNRTRIERIYFSIDFDGLVADALLDDPDFWSKELPLQKAELMRRGKLLVGKQTVGMQATGSGGGSFPQLEPLSLKPPVDIIQPTQTHEK